MKIILAGATLMLSLGLAFAQPANAIINQINFAGYGKVGVATGPWAPALLANNNFAGKIIPYANPLANNVTATINPINDSDTYWESVDSYMFMVDNAAGPGHVDSYSLSGGLLTTFDLFQTNFLTGALRVTNTGFEGWLFDPNDATNNSYYSGAWTFVSAATQRIAPDGTITTQQYIILDKRGGAVPEPANWALMISGFAMTGAVMRQRRVTAGRATASRAI